MLVDTLQVSSYFMQEFRVIMRSNDYMNSSRKTRVSKKNLSTGKKYLSAITKPTQHVESKIQPRASSRKKENLSRNGENRARSRDNPLVGAFRHVTTMSRAGCRRIVFVGIWLRRHYTRAVLAPLRKNLAAARSVTQKERVYNVQRRDEKNSLLGDFCGRSLQFWFAFFPSFFEQHAVRGVVCAR